MYLKTLALATVAAIGVAGTASAATLSLTGGVSGVLPSNYDPAPGTANASIGDAITIFRATANDTSIGGGLRVSGPAIVTYTFLGKEAGARNTAVETIGGGTLVNTGASNLSVTAIDDGGFLDFLFRTSGLKGSPSAPNPAIFNGGISEDSRLAIAFRILDSNSALAFFGDGRGDNDFDDMVLAIDVAPIPLPAAGWMLLAGVGGIAAIRRRRKAA